MADDVEMTPITPADGTPVPPKVAPFGAPTPAAPAPSAPAAASSMACFVAFSMLISSMTCGVLQPVRA